MTLISLRQEDCPASQVTFSCHLPNEQMPRQVIHQLNKNKSKLHLTQAKQNVRAACPKGKLEFTFGVDTLFLMKFNFVDIIIMEKLTFFLQP